ncbi:hypothetical protein CLIB1444_09S01662 [[Candida] jaroonii]|uniref:Uncharacterized protein n=1 Tax=[Candida] jaroonii TaxID=467808 RepID=A0ACA9YC62_9ASCO|nr:hypothetical protein CLIB1444_09S01662 [[Candida] jaroonii]
MSEKQELLNNLLQLAQKEQKQGNKSITQEKLDSLSSYIINQSKSSNYKKYSEFHPIPKSSGLSDVRGERSNNESRNQKTSSYSPLFDKFTLPIPKNNPPRKLSQLSKFKKLENSFINILEVLANILDNLHLFSKFPMFPQRLLGLLKQTNKLWVILLIFLIRKTVSQLLNVKRKENKVKIELNILKSSSKGQIDNSLLKKYEKVLKDLKFDKTMLYLELFGNFLDLAFNVIELSGILVPDWLMNILNFSSMAMTIYRMNKDDEYIDDDITEDLI